jgi:hypothetical protein
MKFSAYFEHNIVSEWREFYINHELLKTLMWPFRKFYKEHLAKIGVDVAEHHHIHPTHKHLAVHDVGLHERLLHHEEHDISIQNNFAEQFLIELKKVEYFFNYNCQFYHTRLEKIKEQLEHVRNNITTYKDQYEQLENAMKELYKEIHLMKSYIHLNFKTKSKKLEKFKKYTRHLTYKIDLDEQITNFVSFTSLGTAYQTINHFITQIDHLFTVHFTQKYRHNVLKEIKEYVTPVYLTGTQSFYFGFFIGITFILLLFCWFLCSNFNLDIDRDYEFRTIFPMFRGYFITCLYIWLLAANVYAWEKANVNYKLCFQFNNHYSHVIQILIRVSILTAVGTLMMLCYIILRIKLPIIYDIVSFIPLNLTPLICWLVFIFYMLTPLKIFNYEGIMYTYRLLAESLFIYIQFRHIWFLDQLTSFVGPMRDIEYTLCYYAYYYETTESKVALCSQSRAIVLITGIFPHVFRALQCLRIVFTNSPYPQIFNFGKYMTAITVMLFSFFAKMYPPCEYVWFVSAGISTIYSTYWDIKYDFGFLENSAAYPLREKLSYNNKFFYYFVLFTNLFLRFMWVLSVSPEVVYQFIRPEFFMVIIYSMEVIRRGMWNFIRVELQHIQLCKEFRVVNYVDLPFKKNKSGEFELVNPDVLNKFMVKEGKADKRINSIRKKLTLKDMLHSKSGKVVQQLDMVEEKVVADEPGVAERKSMLANYLGNYNKEVVKHLERVEDEDENASFEVDEDAINEESNLNR